MTELHFESAPDGSMLAEFVRALTSSGEVMVGSADVTPEDEDAALVVLEDVERQAREELAPSVPPFDPTAAIWGAKQFYRACRFLLCRDIPGDEVIRQLELVCPRPRGPATDFSVDLVLRYLPQLLSVAERSGSNDALTLSLRDWARSWPLSSVGAGVEGPFVIESFAESPALLRLYADRILQHAAADRLGDPRVAARIKADLGAFPELAPILASKLDRVAAPPP